MCIRDSPNSQGVFVGIAPDSPELQAASQKCGKYLPDQTHSPAQKRQILKQLVAFSQCVRSHGVPDFPDPTTSGGGVNLRTGSAIDPYSSIVQRALRACSKLPRALPPGGP